MYTRIDSDCRHGIFSDGTYRQVCECEYKGYDIYDAVCQVVYLPYNVSTVKYVERANYAVSRTDDPFVRVFVTASVIVLLLF